MKLNKRRCKVLNKIKKFCLNNIMGVSTVVVPTIGEIQFKVDWSNEKGEKLFCQELYDSTNKLSEEGKILKGKHVLGSYVCNCEVLPEYGQTVYNTWKNIIQKYADCKVLKIVREKNETK